MTYDKPITIQYMSEDEDMWVDKYNLHARVNKSRGNRGYEAGTLQSYATLDFEVRYFKALEDISFMRGDYRIMYRGHTYEIDDYDDYMEQHKTVRLTGVSNG